MTDPLAMTVHELLERIAAPPAAAEADPWVDAATAPCGWRHIVAAAKRGELEASRVGRRVLVRRSELERWLSAQRIEIPKQQASAEPKPGGRVAHLLARAGYSRAEGSRS